MDSIPAPTQPAPSPFDLSKVNGPNVALCGAIGTGKTYSLATAAAAGYNLAVVFTEPGGEETLIDALRALGVSDWEKRVFWQTIAPANPSWSTMLNTVKLVGSQSYEELTKLKHGINKAQHQQFVQVYGAFANFIDHRTGKVIGDIDKLPNNWCIALDGLSGLNIMAQEHVVGARPTLHEGEWGVAMNDEEKLIMKLCSIRAMFVLIAHLEYATSEDVGSQRLMMNALGRKLAPKLPRFFSEVILTKRNKTEFSWSNTDTRTDLKNRLLPIRENLRPSFDQLLPLWLNRYQFTTDQWKGQGVKVG